MSERPEFDLHSFFRKPEKIADWKTPQTTTWQVILYVQVHLHAEVCEFLDDPIGTSMDEHDEGFDPDVSVYEHASHLEMIATGIEVDFDTILDDLDYYGRADEIRAMIKRGHEKIKAGY